MLILQTLGGGPLHGWAIAQRIHVTSRDLLTVEEGSLYPCLYRMEQKNWIKAEWGISEKGRRAKFYQLTRAGRKHLGLQAAGWQRLVTAISAVMETE